MEFSITLLDESLNIAELNLKFVGSMKNVHEPYKKERVDNQR